VSLALGNDFLGGNVRVGLHLEVVLASFRPSEDNQLRSLSPCFGDDVLEWGLLRECAWHSLESPAWGMAIPAVDVGVENCCKAHLWLVGCVRLEIVF